MSFALITKNTIALQIFISISCVRDALFVSSVYDTFGQCWSHFFYFLYIFFNTGVIFPGRVLNEHNTTASEVSILGNLCPRKHSYNFSMDGCLDSSSCGTGNPECLVPNENIQTFKLDQQILKNKIFRNIFPNKKKFLHLLFLRRNQTK